MLSDDELRKLLSELKSANYLKLPFTINSKELSQAADSFFEFLLLPDDIKNHIQLKITPDHRRGEIGYWQRSSHDDLYSDDKEFFHFHPIIFDHYQDFIKNNRAIEQFLSQAMVIWQATYDLISQIMKILDSNYPGCWDKIFSSNEPHIILRFLKYDWSKSGKYLAKPHFDAGSFTLALAESTPGLRIGKGPNDLEFVTHESDKALFFFSSNYRKIIESEEFSPAWHDVIQLDETQLGNPFSRWAIVAFIDGHSVSALPRSETHKVK